MYERVSKKINDSVVSLLDCGYSDRSRSSGAVNWFNYLAFSVFVLSLIGVLILDFFFGGE